MQLNFKIHNFFDIFILIIISTKTEASFYSPQKTDFRRIYGVINRTSLYGEAKFTSLSINKLKELSNKTYRSNVITDTIAVFFIICLTVGFFKCAIVTFFNLFIMAPNRSSAIFLERYPPNYLAANIKVRGKNINKHEFSNLLHRENGGYVISA